MIHLEPREKYDEAILEEDYECDVVIYSYDSLVDILMKDLRVHFPDKNNQQLFFIVKEHIDYNIEGMRGNHKDWPIFSRDEQHEEHKKNHT